MIKTVKPAIVCAHCGSQLKPEVQERFCDYCQGKIPEDVDLDVSTFWKDFAIHATRNEFCSATCVRQWLRDFPYNRDEVRFISLPSISNFKGLYEFLAIKKEE